MVFTMVDILSVILAVSALVPALVGVFKVFQHDKTIGQFLTDFESHKGQVAQAVGDASIVASAVGQPAVAADLNTIQSAIKNGSSSGNS